MESETADIAAVRRFNRVVTQRVGALHDRFLARDRPLAAARVLWEIGVDGCEVKTLRRRLGLDSGHASRLLRSLEADGLVELRPSPADARVRTAYLTPAGLAERTVVDERSDELARSLLAPLSPRQQRRLVTAMQDVERLLSAADVTLVRVDPTHPDARTCLRAYATELDRRFPEGFDPEAGVSAAPAELRPPAGEILVAYRNDEPVGCGAVKHHRGERWSEVKRVWVSDSVRGLGLARRLLAALEARAAAAGSHAVRLDTHRTLTEAIALYRATGYREVPPFNDNPYAHHWFSKDVA